MFSLSLPWPFLGWTLLLTPRWGEFGVPWQATLLAASCLVPLALIGWLYRYELKLVSCFSSLVLLATRIVALAALLFLVLLQPIFAFTRTWEEPGRVLVAVDRSQSMDVADPQRKPVDKLRLARALGLNHGVCTDDQLDQWIRDYQDPKLGSPQWVRDDEARDDPRRRADLEAARRVQHDKVCELVDHETRTQIEQSILSDDGLGLLSSLAAKQKVELIGFHGTSWNVPADHPETLFGARALRRGRLHRPAPAAGPRPGDGRRRRGPAAGRRAADRRPPQRRRPARQEGPGIGRAQGPDLPGRPGQRSRPAAGRDPGGQGAARRLQGRLGRRGRALPRRRAAKAGRGAGAVPRRRQGEDASRKAHHPPRRQGSGVRGELSGENGQGRAADAHGDRPSGRPEDDGASTPTRAAARRWSAWPRTRPTCC